MISYSNHEKTAFYELYVYGVFLLLLYSRVHSSCNYILTRIEAYKIKLTEKYRFPWETHSRGRAHE